MVQNSLTTQNVGSVAAELRKRNIGGQEWKVLKETIFPNAADASILMAVDYCKVRHLDMSAKGEGKNKGGMIPFAWFVWEHGYKGKPQIEWILEEVKFK